MKTASKTLLSGLFVLVAFSGCTHKVYDEVEDVGEWRSLAAGEREGVYYRLGDSIYGGYFVGKPEDNRIPMGLRCVGMGSFVVCVGSEYARDDNNVYYPIEALYVDGVYEDGTGWGEKRIIRYVVEDADPKTFKYLGEDYAIDKRRMYLRGERIPWDDNVIEQAKMKRRHQ